MIIGKNIPHLTIESSSPSELVEIKTLFSTPVSVLYAKTDNSEIVVGRGNYITNQPTSGSAIAPGFYYAGSSAIRIVSADSDFATFVASAKQYGVDAFFANSTNTVILVPKAFDPEDIAS